MGAIVGGALATGMPVNDMEKAVTTADWDHIFGDKPKRKDIPYFRKPFDYLSCLMMIDILESTFFPILKNPNIQLLRFFTP